MKLIKTIILLSALIIGGNVFALPIERERIKEIITTFKANGGSPQASVYLQDNLNAYLQKAQNIQQTKITPIKQKIQALVKANTFNIKQYNKTITQLNRINSAINKEYQKAIALALSKFNKQDRELLFNIISNIYPINLN